MSVELPQKYQQLKVEIKEWEHLFERENGRKPGRADLKACGSIFTKYNAYHRFRARHLRESAPQTPSKKPAVAVEYESGYKGNAASPSTPKKPLIVVDQVGPTPQLAGRVMGLFELQSPEMARQAKGTTSADVGLATPSKSPTSVTRADSQHLPILETPTKQMSTSPQMQRTPAYLQVTAHAEPDSPWAPRRSRSLTSILAGLKDNQSDPLLESDEPAYEPAFESEELGSEYEEEDDAYIERLMQGDGKTAPLEQEHTKTYKKKGQKRTTRRVVMRPVKLDAEGNPKKLKKQGENFKRLKLRNSGFKPNRSKFRRR